MSTALTATGCITAMSAVIAVSGGFLSITLNCDLHWTIPWASSRSSWLGSRSS